MSLICDSVPQGFIDLFKKSTAKIIDYKPDERGCLLHPVFQSYFRYCKSHRKKQPLNLVYIWNKTQGIEVIDATNIITAIIENPSVVGYNEAPSSRYVAAITALIFSQGLNPKIRAAYDQVVKKAVSPVSIHHRYADRVSNMELTCKHRLVNIALTYNETIVYQNYKEIKTDDGYRYVFVYENIDCFHFPNMLPVYDYFGGECLKVRFDYRFESDIGSHVYISYCAYLFDRALPLVCDHAFSECTVMPLGRDNYFLMNIDFMEMAAFAPQSGISREEAIRDFIGSPEYAKRVIELQNKKDTFLLGLSTKVAPGASISRHFNGPFGERNLIRLILSFLPKDID